VLLLVVLLLVLWCCCVLPLLVLLALLLTLLLGIQRGEKHSNWEGGMRVSSFVSGGLIPQNLRGTLNNITMHVVDWYIRILPAGALLK